MSKDNIIIGSKLGDGNILIGTKYGGVIPTTTTTTTSTTTTGAPSYKCVDLCMYYNCDPNACYWRKCACVVTNPAMSVGECFNFCVCGYGCVDNSDGGSTYAVAATCCPWLVVQATPGCCNPCSQGTDFPVCYGDNLTVEVATCTDNCLLSYASLCISGITSISGSFCLGSICTSINTYTPAPIPNDINLCEYSYNGGDGSYQSYRCLCIESTPAMNVGDCYCLCLCTPLELSGALLGSGSYSDVHVYCNGNFVFSACITNQSCIMASTSFCVKYGDTVCIGNEAYVTALGCINSANSCTCIFNVTSIVGSYQIGTTCCKSCSYTG